MTGKSFVNIHVYIQMAFFIKENKKFELIVSYYNLLLFIQYIEDISGKINLLINNNF